MVKNELRENEKSLRFEYVVENSRENMKKPILFLYCIRCVIVSGFRQSVSAYIDIGNSAASTVPNVDIRRDKLAKTIYDNTLYTILK